MEMNKARALREQRPLLWLLAAVFLVMLVLNFLTPMAVDDYSYSFSWATDQRIRSLGDILQSMAVHRSLTNGRVIPHAMVQLFLIPPKGLFNFVNAANAVLLLVLMSRFLRPSTGWSMALPILCAALMIWNFTPSFGENFLWLDGSVNYSWGMSLLLLFLWPYAADYLEIPRKQSLTLDLLRVLLSFLAGAYSENGSLCFLFLAFCLAVLCRIKKKRLPVFYYIWFLAAAAGYLFLMTAPATAGRGTGFSISGLANNLFSVLKTTMDTQLWLYMIYGCLLALALGFRVRKEVILLSALLAAGGLVSLSAFVFALYFVPRHLCCSCLLTVLAAALLLGELLGVGKKQPVRLLLAAMTVLFVFRFAFGALDIAVCFHKAREREEQIRAALAAGERELTIENCIPFTRYAFDFILNDSDSEIWPNNVVRTYYGLDKIYGVDPDVDPK